MRRTRRGIPYFYIQTLILFVILSACNPAKKLQKEELLLSKNIVSIKGAKLEKTDIDTYIKLKPNRKILGFVRFHLWLYNLANENRIAKKRKAYNEKLRLKNERRIAKGKAKTNGREQLFGEWLLSVGEPPVVYDSFAVQKSAKQIKMLLANKGYFINTVTDSLTIKRGKKANVFYEINASKPYTINAVTYNIADAQLKQFVFSDTAGSLLQKGNNYDVDEIQKERERITNTLNNNGFYLFTQDYIYFEIDTNLNNRKANISIGIKNFAQKIPGNADSIAETTHQRFTIGNVYIQPDFVSAEQNMRHTDTLQIDNYVVLQNNKLNYKIKVLLEAIFIHKGDTYKLKNSEDTYKRLSELKSFKSIRIYYIQSDSGQLDCHIQLSPIFKQSFTIETEGTNTSGNLGVSGSFIFQNRNLFKGAELLELRLKGGIAAQRLANTTSKNLTSNAREFNTIEFGPELNLYVPRFLLPFKVYASKRANPKTVFTSALNYQKRPDYERTITNFSLGYTWKETAQKTHVINPLVINFVKVDLSNQFSSDLQNNIRNQFILYSFSNHLSTSSRYTFTFNQQDLKKQKNFAFFRLNAESSGSILRGLYNLTNRINENTFVKDNQGRFTFLDIAYSQYLRMDADYRYYFNPNPWNKIVFRIAGGIGKPLSNFRVLPFERSFFSGGANSLRAWQTRSLGPGSYYNKNFSFDQFGDGQLEGNIEYRFKMFKMLNGAFFIDAGNTWLRQPETNRPGGDFQFNRFYKEIAIGTGFGVRADFDFFIIRFDWGLKARDPQFAEKERWVIEHWVDPQWKKNYYLLNNREYSFLAFNIGIGYPF